MLTTTFPIENILVHRADLMSRSCTSSNLNYLYRNDLPSSRTLPSSWNPHFQNEAKCTTFLVKMSFICMRMKSHFRIKGWALNLVLIQRLGNGLFGRREKFRGRAQTRGSSKPPPFACSLARSVKANKRLPRRLHLSDISSKEKKTRSAILSSAT